MQQTRVDNNNNRPSPARRRDPNRHLNRPNPARKSYASENDMASDTQFPLDFPEDNGPQTPQKSASGSPGPSSVPGQAKSKGRQGNRGRAKNLSTSPGSARPGRGSPPDGIATRPTTTTAFAGATFHASPAPSSLPIPSFLMKTMADSPAQRATVRNPSQEPSPPATDSEAPTPLDRTSALQPAGREESPLDMFFRVDRAEKERARRASSANALAAVPGPFSPPSQSQSPARECNTFPKGSSAQPIRRSGPQRVVSSGISANELDGTPGQPMGPAFSTPYQERIRAARSGEKQPMQQPFRQQQQPRSAQQTPQAPSDMTEALKKFLFAGQPKSAEAVITPAVRPAQPTTSTPSHSSSGASLAQPSTGFTSTAPNGLESGRTSDLQLMEDHLRRVLKLGPTSNVRPSSSITPPRQSQQFH